MARKMPAGVLDFDRILNPLTTSQQQAIRDVFHRKRRPGPEANSLLHDWFRLAEVAHYHALKSYIPQSTREVLLSPSVRNRRDRQLRQATEAARTAVRAINELVEIIGKHSGLFRAEQSPQLEGWVQSVVERLQSLERETEQYRLMAQAWPPVTKRRGTPRWLIETYLLEVLVAYFRKRGWPIARSQTGLFAEVALAVLGKDSMNQMRLRALVESNLDYDALERTAPRDVQYARPPIARVNPHADT